MNKNALPALLLAAAGLFFSPSLQSQTQFVPGYYINLQGDTVRGKIDRQAGSRTPREIQFQHEGQPMLINVQNAEGFGIDKGPQFSRHILSYSPAPVELQKLKSDQYDFSTITDTVFLGKLVSGKWQLYSLYVGKYVYFIQKENEPPTELTYVVKLSPDGLYINENSVYRNQLNNLLLANHIDPAALGRLETLNYTANDLVSFVTRLNRLQGATTAKAGNGPARKIFHLYGGVGYSFNSFYVRKTGSTAFDPFQYMDYTSAGSATFQAGLEFSNKDLLGPVALRLDASTFGLKVKGSGMYNELNYYKDLHLRYEMDGRYVQTALQALVSAVKTKKIDVFLGPAFAINFVSYKKNRVYRQYEGEEAVYYTPASNKTITQLQAIAGATVLQHYQVLLKQVVLGEGSISSIDAKNRATMTQVQVNYRF